MEQIKTLAQLSPLISSQWRRGVVTNAPFSPGGYRREIEAGTLYAQTVPGGLLLLRRREGFFRLYFYLQPEAGLDQWRPPGPTVLEIAVRPRDAALKETEGRWEALGFRLLFSRLRLTWSHPQNLLPPGSACTVRTAAREELDQIFRLMLESYDPRTACLPTPAELEADRQAGRVFLALTPQGETAGFLRAAGGGRTAEIRHMAVTRAHRGKGIARAMYAHLLGREEYRRAAMWVARDNRPALGLYENIGFTPDGWTSTVWSYD